MSHPYNREAAVRLIVNGMAAGHKVSDKLRFIVAELDKAEVRSEHPEGQENDFYRLVGIETLLHTMQQAMEKLITRAGFVPLRINNLDSILDDNYAKADKDVS